MSYLMQNVTSRVAWVHLRVPVFAKGFWVFRRVSQESKTPLELAVTILREKIPSSSISGSLENFSLETLAQMVESAKEKVEETQPVRQPCESFEVDCDVVSEDEYN